MLAGVLEPDGVDDELGSGLVGPPGFVGREVQVRAAHPASDEAIAELVLCFVLHQAPPSVHAAASLTA